MNSPILLNEAHIKYNLVHLKQIVFEVTDACNLQCKYCANLDLYQKVKTKKHGVLSFNKAKNILDYLAGLWKEYPDTSVCEPLTVSFYGGEPLLSISLIRKIIDYCESLEGIGKKCKYSMTTNAMLLDKHMDYLVNKNFQLLISLDGNEEGQSYRVDHQGRNSFQSVINNIRLLKEKYPSFFATNVNFNSVLHDRNNILSICDFIKKEFDKYPSISSMNPSNVCKEKMDEFNKMWVGVFDDYSQAVSKCGPLDAKLFLKSPYVSEAANYVFKKSGNIFDSYLNFFAQNEKLDYVLTGTCIPFSKRLFVTTTGRILQCERISHDFSLGEVTDQEVNLNLQGVADFFNRQVRRYYKNQCVRCALLKQCKECIYTIEEDEKSCPFYSNKTNDIVRKNSVSTLMENPEFYEKIMNEVIIK